MIIGSSGLLVMFRLNRVVERVVSGGAIVILGIQEMKGRW
jgi:hypothetical protein